jgi:hypothetical protein
MVEGMALAIPASAPEIEEESTTTIASARTENMPAVAA